MLINKVLLGGALKVVIKWRILLLLVVDGRYVHNANNVFSLGDEGKGSYQVPPHFLKRASSLTGLK